MSVWKTRSASEGGGFTLIEINNAACEARRLKREDALGKSTLEVDFIDTTVEKIFHEVLSAGHGRTAGRFQYIHNRPDVFEVRLFPLFEDCVVATFEDISFLRESEDRVTREREAKEEILKGKASLLACVSHELRSPLNGIIGGTELLMKDPLRKGEYVNTIQKCSMSLLRLVNDLLDYSKADAGKLQLEPRETDLCEVIETALDTVVCQAHQKGLHLGYHMSSEIPSIIHADPARLQQILVNLLTNSVKFTYHGEIVVTARIKKQKKIEVNVRDTGIGIPQEKLPNIFKEYSQLEPGAQKSPLGGTGLGLAISKQLVTLMGGKITVETEYGKGSTFQFTLPLVPLPMSSPEPGEGPLPSRTALIVSQSRSSIIQLTGHLVLWNVKVFWSDSPPEGDCGCNIIFQDYTLRAQELEWDIEGMPCQFSKPLGDPSIVGLTPITVAILGPGASVPEGTVVDHTVQFPLHRQELFQLVTGSRPKRKNSSTKLWENYGHSHPLRILVVDDNTLDLKVTTRMLELMGYSEVDTACDGKDALDHVLTFPPYNLILMDINMPNMDGRQAAGSIRHRDKTVFICGLSGEDEKSMGLPASMNTALLKPVSMSSLFEVIRACGWEDPQRDEDLNRTTA
jgi:signal transduction histidine kinase